MEKEHLVIITARFPWHGGNSKTWCHGKSHKEPT